MILQVLFFDEVAMVSQSERDRQVQQAQELLGEQHGLGFAKGLYFGKFVANALYPYPVLAGADHDRVDAAVRDVRHFAEDFIDPAAIDRAADIPRDIIDGLGKLGVLGMTAPVEFGGRGFSQAAYCRVLEIIGGRCSATSIFVNAHHSIGIRALLLFGTDDQKRRWLPGLVTGEKLAAFALTEPEAGSDAANVQTTATLSPDGTHYILTGTKRYITNAAIAQVLTVMAKTPVPGKSEPAVTAFLVTPDMPGFRVVEGRMEKLGIRGTATGKLAFENMPVPKENILGPLGKGLRVALTVLDFGRTTFGACCTGAAKTAMRLAVEHAKNRRQFSRTLGEFELVKKKLAQMAAWTYAMEAMTYSTAGLIDRGLEDYMLETAMLKVWSTEALWTILNDSFQIHGGAAYFTDKPLERMLRDGRINQIGEGANDVLKSFIALVGMRGPGENLKDVWDALHSPFTGFGRIWKFGIEQMGTALSTPTVPVRQAWLEPHAQRLGAMVRALGGAVQRMLMKHKEEILERQYVHERIAEVAMEIFASACVLGRMDAELPPTNGVATSDQSAAELFLALSRRRVRQQLESLNGNEDALLTQVADQMLK